MVPSSLMGGELGCSGCGFEAISWGMLARFTKATLSPTRIVIVRRLAPADVMVMVPPTKPVTPELELPAGLPPPPQATARTAAARTGNSRAMPLEIVLEVGSGMGDGHG